MAGAGKIADALVHDPRWRERLLLARSLGISEKRLLGWEPTQTHQHVHAHDAWGRPTHLLEVRVTTEPEWDDHERAKMQALGIYEAGICGCGCGVHRSLMVPGVHFHEIAQETCPVGASLDQFRRVQAEADQAYAKRVEDAPPQTPHPGDGRQTFLRPVSAEEARSRAEKASAARQLA